MTSESKKGNGKKSYQKPSLQEVRLAPEEVLLAGCKTNISGATKSNGGCNGPNLCLASGS